MELIHNFYICYLCPNLFSHLTVLLTVHFCSRSGMNLRPMKFAFLSMVFLYLFKNLGLNSIWVTQSLTTRNFPFTIFTEYGEVPSQFFSKGLYR